LLFNGSLSFWKYFQINGLSVEAVKNILTNSKYPTFGPWDGQNVAAIWNLNIFSNQRHLAPAMGLTLLILYCLNFKKIHPFLLSLLIGSVIFINQAVFAGLAVFLVWHFLLNSDRIYLIKAAIFTLPWLLASQLLIHLSADIIWHPGFLMHDPVTWFSAIKFWLDNLGLHLVLIPIGVILAPTKAKKLALPLLTLFIIPNLFQLSVDMFNNHKLFNLFQVFGVMFSAWSLVWLVRKKWTLPLVAILLFLLIFSGIIDFFAFKNDSYFTLADRKSNLDIEFAYSHIPAKSIVLNSTWFFHPASLAGRLIFNGYTYFTWSHGYDSYAREKILVNIYEATNKQTACQLLTTNHIGYVELNDRPEAYLHPNFPLWHNEFTSIYNNSRSGTTFYDVQKSCSSI
jgi:hypothetical protein